MANKPPRPIPAELALDKALDILVAIASGASTDPAGDALQILVEIGPRENIIGVADFFAPRIGKREQKYVSLRKKREADAIRRSSSRSTVVVYPSGEGEDPIFDDEDVGNMRPRKLDQTTTS